MKEACWTVVNLVAWMFPFSFFFKATASGMLMLVAYPLCGVVGYVPTLVVAAICVFIGADFLYDSLEARTISGPP